MELKYGSLGTVTGRKIERRGSNNLTARKIWEGGREFILSPQRAVANAGSAERRSRSRSRTTRICRGPFPTMPAISRTFLPWSRWKMTNWFLFHHKSSLNLEAVTSGLRCLAERRTMSGLRLDSPCQRADSVPSRPRPVAVRLRSVLGSKRFRTGNAPFVGLLYQAATAFSASLE